MHIYTHGYIHETLCHMILRAFTLTLIFRETLARYCLLTLKTCFVRQHWDIKPRSVSHILLRSPEHEKQYYAYSHERSLCMRIWKNRKPNKLKENTLIPYREPLLSGRIAISNSSSFPLSLFIDEW